MINYNKMDLMKIMNQKAREKQKDKIVTKVFFLSTK
jgi:hypothetical protein